MNANRYNFLKGLSLLRRSLVTATAGIEWLFMFWWVIWGVYAWLVDRPGYLDGLFKNLLNNDPWGGALFVLLGILHFVSLSPPGWFIPSQSRKLILRKIVTATSFVIWSTLLASVVLVALRSTTGTLLTPMLMASVDLLLLIALLRQKYDPENL